MTDNVSDDACFYVSTGNLTIGGGAGKLIISNKTSYSTIQTAPSNNNKKTITIKNNASFENCTYYCISITGTYYLNIEGGSFINNTYVPINIAKSTSAEITMTSGTITGNSHTTNGSSFYLNSGKLTITGGTVKNNKIGSTFKGAAIWVASGATATVGGETLTSSATYSSDIEL